MEIVEPPHTQAGQIGNRREQAAVGDRANGKRMGVDEDNHGPLDVSR